MKKLDHSKDYQSYLYMGYVWIAIVSIMLFLTSCTGTYYITDSELVIDDYDRVHPTKVYYYNDLPYWGYYSGYYYYYGKPHYYPWYYYYNTCPPSHYNTTTHVIITRPVNKPTHRPNRPTVRPNRPVKNNTTIKVKTNRTNNKVIVKPNNNNKVKTNRSNTKTRVNRKSPR